MSEPVVYCVNRSQYFWRNAIMIVATVLSIAVALGSTDHALNRVGLLFAPLCALAAVGLGLTLILRYPRLVLSDSGITWKLPLFSRSWTWRDCVDVSSQQIRSTHTIRIGFSNGHRLVVVPAQRAQADELYAALNLGYEQHRSNA